MGSPQGVSPMGHFHIRSKHSFLLYPEKTQIATAEGEKTPQNPEKFLCRIDSIGGIGYNMQGGSAAAPVHLPP